MGTFVWVGFVALLAGLAVPLQAGPADEAGALAKPILPFSAQLSPSEPIHVSGSLLPAAGEPFSVALHAEPGGSASAAAADPLFYSASCSIVWVYEIRWVTVAGESTPPQFHGPGVIWNDVTGFAEALGEANQFAILSVEPFEDQVALGNAAEFTVEPARSRVVENGGWAPKYAREYWSATPVLVKATAHVDRVSVSGNGQIFVYDATVRINGIHGDSHTRENRTFETGTFRAASPVIPGAYDHVVRFLGLYTESHEVTANFKTTADFAVSGRWNVTVQSPDLVLTGQLDIPASPGGARWGAWESGDPLPSLRPAGVFNVGAEKLGHLSIAGATWNGPPSVLDPIPQPPLNPLPWILPVVAAAAVAWALWRWHAALLSLFSRVRVEELLENPTRRTIQEIVSENPGITPSEILDILKIRRGTLRYHLAYLLIHGRLERREFGGHVALFVPGRVSSELQPLVYGLRHEGIRQLLEVLQRRGPLRQRQLADILDVTPQYVSAFLRRLVNMGVLKASGSGRRRVYSVPPNPEKSTG